MKKKKFGLDCPKLIAHTRIKSKRTTKNDCNKLSTLTRPTDQPTNQLH